MVALNNPKDPLLKTSATTDKDRQLFEKLAVTCNGYDHEAVISAALNLLINTVRQSQPKAQEASSLWDESFGKGKSLLLDHYDMVTGKRKNIFPFTQHVTAPFHIDKDTLRK
jgi:hypothetical protein